MEHQHSNDGIVRRKLSDILNENTDTFRTAWETTRAAGDFTPLPAGTYDAQIVGGELFTSRSGTPGYKLTFRIVDGEYAGRYVWHDLWLTPAAMAMTKRDLAKIGVTSPDQLDRPIPAVLLCKVRVVTRSNDDGRPYNTVRSFVVTGLDNGDDPDFGSPSPTPTIPQPPTTQGAPDRLFAPRSVSAMEGGR